MFRLFTRVQFAYVGLFFAACAWVFIYEANYVWPVQKCEAHGGWWSDKYHMCGQPIPIWRITGRLPGAPAAASKGPALTQIAPPKQH